MCSCSRCRNLLALGLAVGVMATHEPPHVHVPTPGEQADWFGQVGIVRAGGPGPGQLGGSRGPSNNQIHVVHAASRAQHEAATFAAIRQTLCNNRARVRP
jgi:hypothetical protein